MKKILALTLFILLALAGVGWATDTIIDQSTTDSGNYIEVGLDSARTQTAQSFTGNGTTLNKAQFILEKSGSPTGNCYALLYADPGSTYGTGETPGTLLATSDAKDVSTITTKGWYEFTFSGAEIYTPANGTKYFIAFKFDGGSAGNFVKSYRDNAGAAGGNGAYKENATWNAYAADHTFKAINVSGIIVSTTAASAIVQTTASSGGSYTDASNPTDVGVCWSTSANPTVAGSHAHGSVGTPFTVNITGLTAATLYHIRSFVVDDAGTTYGDDKTFTTMRNPGTFYMSATGAAANITAATGVAHPANYMNVTVHNAATFVPGDTIKLSDKGGNFTFATNPATLIVPPNSGTSANPIVYTAVTGETPLIEMGWIKDQAANATLGWAETSPGSGIYKVAYPAYYASALWEDNIAVKTATSSDLSDGGWYYGDGWMYYKPTTGTPADHRLIAGYWVGGSDNYVPYAIDLREKSYIEVSGITINHGVVTVANNVTTPVSSLLQGIKIYNCIFNYSLWAVWGQAINATKDAVFGSSEFYNNTFNYCNSGVSIWTSTNTAHTNRPNAIKVYGNTFNHFASVDSRDLYDWAYTSGTLTNDHEAISFQDAVACEVTDNTITMNLPLDNNRRAIFFYQQVNAQSNDNNVVAYNRITGGFDNAIMFQGNTDAGTTDSKGNIIACNVIKNPLASGTLADSDCTGIYVYLLRNTSDDMNYICNNTIYNNCVIAGGEGDGIYIWGANGSGKWTMANNIVSARRYCAGGSATDKTRLVWSNNNYYTGGFSAGGSVSWATWQGYGWDTDVLGSFNGVDPMLRSSDLAITNLSPSAVKTGGTPIENVTVVSGTGQLGIDGATFSVATPSMGAYAGTVPFGGGGTTLGLGTSGGNYRPRP